MREGVSESNKNDDVGGVRRLRKRALENVVQDESGTGLDAVFEENNATTEMERPKSFVQ